MDVYGFQGHAGQPSFDFRRVIIALRSYIGGALGTAWEFRTVRRRVYCRARSWPSLSLVCLRHLARVTSPRRPEDAETKPQFILSKMSYRRNGNETETTIDAGETETRARPRSDNVINDFLARCTPAPYCRSGQIIRRREPHVFGVNAHVLKRNFCRQRYQTHNKLYANTYAHTAARDPQSYVLFSERKKITLYFPR